MSQNSAMLTLEADIKSGTQLNSLSYGSNRVPIISSIVTFVFSIAAGLLIGVLLLISSLFFYLYIIQPLIAGFLLAFILEAVIKITKLRHTKLVLILGLLAGLIAYGTYRYGTFLDFQNTVANEFRANSASYSDEEISTAIDEWLTEQTGFGGFFGFVHLEAQEGLSVSFNFRGRSTGELFRTNMFFTYVYWVVEIAIMLLFPALIAEGQARAAYCTSENKWLKLEPIAYIANEQVEMFLEALKRGDFENAAQFLQSEQQLTNVQIGMCDLDAQEAVLKVEIDNGKNRSIIVNPTVISGQVARMFMSSKNKNTL